MNHFEDVSVLSVRKTGDYFNSAPAAWKALREFVHKRGLEGQDMRFIGAYHDNPDITAEGNLRSEACCTAPADVEPEGEVMRKVIEGGKYATFEHQGPLNTLGTTYDKIFADWYPGSGETLSSKPCLVELSELPNSGDRIYSEVKIHIPLE